MNVHEAVRMFWKRYFIFLCRYSAGRLVTNRNNSNQQL